MRAWIIVAFGLGGCATSGRVGLAPTLDSDGRWGAVVTLTAAFGDTYRRGNAAVLVAADVSGALDERARRVGDAGHLGLGVAVDALGESPHFGFRIGATLTGRAILPTGESGGGVGARLAFLPVVRATHHAHDPGHCGDESWAFVHVGLELSGQYLWGPDARGLFAAGPVLEFDALAERVCD